MANFEIAIGNDFNQNCHRLSVGAKIWDWFLVEAVDWCGGRRGHATSKAVEAFYLFTHLH